MNESKIDDALLSASLDGELDAADQARVAAWLLEHPADAGRLQQWRADAEALRRQFGPVADEPVPDAMLRTVWQRRPPSPIALAASAAALLLIGGLVGALVAWQVQRRDEALAAGTAAGWVERAAYAHAVFTPEPRHPVEVRAQEDHLARWLTSRIQVPVKLFDLHGFGFELVGGRLLPDGPGKSAQLMYENAAKTRITVYLRKPEAGADAAFRYERHGELGLFYWVEDGAGFALVGALPKEQLLAMCESIYRQMEAAGAPSAPHS